MKKFILISILSLSGMQLSAAEPKSYRLAPGDTTPRLGTGFTLTACAGMIYNFAGDGYLLNVSSGSSTILEQKYAMKSAIGYRYGIGIGFQSRSFGMEVPFSLVTDRFKVPSISTSDRLKVVSLETGINLYFKFLKEKNYILFGPHVGFDKSFGGEERWNSLGLNLGYGYNITKRLNVSLRYKLNFRGAFNDSWSLYIRKTEGTDNKGSTIESRDPRYSGLQLMVRFDLVNTRKMKTNVPPPPPPRIPQSYVSYSDTDLARMLKEAKAKGDMEAAGDMQREFDQRKARSPYGKYDDQQLQDMINKAVQKEDFDEADRLQKEQKRRAAIKAVEQQ